MHTPDGQAILLKMFTPIHGVSVDLFKNDTLRVSAVAMETFQLYF